MGAAAEYLGEDLIFIISQPRSGSTLLQRVLAGHPDIQTSAETWLMLHPIYGFGRGGIRTEYDHGSAAHGIREFLQFYTDGEQVYTSAIRAWARELYGNALRKGGKQLFLDKTPRYYFIVPELYRVFPRARFIFLLRNPLAVLASELKTYVKDDWNKLSSFDADLRKAPGLILAGIKTLGDKATVIRYEEFVSDPERNITALCQSLGLSFHESMLDYGKTEAPRGKMNDPVGIHRHTRPSTESLDKWKSLAADRQARHLALAYLRDLGEDTLAQFGYSYADIAQALQSGRTAGSGMLYPWQVAITPQENWNFRQRASSELYYALRRRGPLLGPVAAGWRMARYLWRQLKAGLRAAPRHRL